MGTDLTEKRRDKVRQLAKENAQYVLIPHEYDIGFELTTLIIETINLLTLLILYT